MIMQPTPFTKPTMTRLSSLVLAVLLLVVAALAHGHTQPMAQVPTVGCRSDGQIGPQPAPTKPPSAPRVPAALVGRLAFYAAKEGHGVLGPRGWKCFGLYGSNGSSLYVMPDLPKDQIKAHLTGPAIELADSVGETSGRFEAAQVAARLFPTRQAFVDRVIAEGVEPASEFPKGPGPHDRIRRLGRDRVWFETPAGEEGVGTRFSRMAKSGEPIYGVAVMDDDNDAAVAAIRLPPRMQDLAPAIQAGVR